MNRLFGVAIKICIAINESKWLNWARFDFGSDMILGVLGVSFRDHLGVTEVKNVNQVKNMKTAPIQNLIMSFCKQKPKLKKHPHLHLQGCVGK